MNINVRKYLGKLINPVASKLGYTRITNGASQNLNELDKHRLLDTLFTNLKAMGLAPKHIIDVGANHGNWTREAMKYFPDAYYTLIEPQKWLESFSSDILNKGDKVSFHAVGAGAKAGSFKFTLVERDDSCSFRYTEEEALQLGYKQIDIPIVTLNELVNSTAHLLIPEIVKIDAEGLDLEVLKGADYLFGKTEVFMVEAGVGCKVLDNSCLKMIQFMDTIGYRLFDITDLNRPFDTKILWLVELAFVKRNGIVDSYMIT